MYGCFDPVLVYGVGHSPSNTMLSRDLCERFGVESYATGVVRNCATGHVYGIPVSCAEEGSLMKVNAEVREKVWKFYTHVKEIYRCLVEELEPPSLQVAICGDYDDEECFGTGVGDSDEEDGEE